MSITKGVSMKMTKVSDYLSQVRALVASQSSGAVASLNLDRCFAKAASDLGFDLGASIVHAAEDVAHVAAAVAGKVEKATKAKGKR